jgi:hypothetical protein
MTPKQKLALIAVINFVLLCFIFLGITEAYFTWNNINGIIATGIMMLLIVYRQWIIWRHL